MPEGPYDVAIIGLGPAGATAARLLDSRLRVIAIDQKQAAGGFQKPRLSIVGLEYLTLSR